MTTKKRLPRVLAFALVLALMTALAVPGVAEIATNIPDSWQTIEAWKGSVTPNGGLARLRDNGQDAVMTVATSGYTNWKVRPYGTGYIIVNSANRCVNINLYRVDGIYFNCTAYPLSGNGQDQIVNISSYPGNLSLIRLATTSQINGGGNWYLMTDRSAPATSSNVIWYQFSGGAPLKAQWQ